MSTHLPPTVLVIDLDNVVRTTISNTLERNGFNATKASGAVEALDILSRDYNAPQMVIVSQTLEYEDMKGIDFCVKVHSMPNYANLPMIVTATLEDNIKSFENVKRGYNDFIIKPFAQAELIQKAKVLLGKMKPELRPKVLRFKDLSMDLASYTVSRNGRDIHLGPTEFKILQCFIERPSKVFSRAELISYIWGSNSEVEPRTVDVHINRLRAALKEPNENIHMIKTMRSAGYCLNIPGYHY